MLRFLIAVSENCFWDSYRSGSEGKNLSVGESYGRGSLSLSLTSTETRSCESALSNNGSSWKRSESDFMNFKVRYHHKISVLELFLLLDLPLFWRILKFPIGFRGFESIFRGCDDLVFVSGIIGLFRNFENLDLCRKLIFSGI